MTHPLRIDLDRGSSVPLYHQVAQSIEAARNAATEAEGRERFRRFRTRN